MDDQQSVFSIGTVILDIVSVLGIKGYGMIISAVLFLGMFIYAIKIFKGEDMELLLLNDYVKRTGIIMLVALIFYVFVIDRAISVLFASSDFVTLIYGKCRRKWRLK